MLWRLGLCGILLAQSAVLLMAQVVRIGGPQAKPRLTNGDSLTVAATPAAITFQLVSQGIATGSAPVVVTTTWGGLSLLSSINVYAFFLDATSALSGGSPVTKIPSSCVLGRDPTGAPISFTMFTQSNPLGGAGASLTLYTSSGLLSLGGSHTDTLSLEINLASLPTLPAGTYAGTLTLQAQAF